MKRIVLALAIFMTTAIVAQKPEKVYSFAKDIRELSWYQTQQQLWEAETKKNSQNGEAWINYYRATRAIRHFAPREKGDFDQAIYDKYDKQCATIVEQLGLAMPKSFEFYYLSAIQKPIGDIGDDILKASQLRPFDPEILDEMMIYYDIKFDQKNKDVYANKLYEINDMPVGALNWGYNILSELDENAILFTYGDNDTYSAWIIQSAKNFRKDVTVINTFMLQMDDYRNKLFKKLGVPPLDVKLAEIQDEAEFESGFFKIMEHLMKGKHPVYFVNSSLDFLKGKYDNQLYLTGLTMKYAETSFDNLAIIKRNFEKRYLLDCLTTIFASNISDETGIFFNGMYLPAMIKLYQHYAESEDVEDQEKVKAWMLKIAQETGKTEEVNKIIEGK